MCALPLVASLMASAKDPMKNKGQVLPYLRDEVNQLSDTCTEGQVCTVPEASRLTTHLEQYRLPCFKNKHFTGRGLVHHWSAWNATPAERQLAGACKQVGMYIDAEYVIGFVADKV